LLIIHLLNKLAQQFYKGLLLKRIILLFFVFVSVAFSQNQILKKGRMFYLSNTVVVKFKSDVYKNGNVPVETLNKNLKKCSIQEAKPVLETNALSLKKGEESLSKIFTLTIDNQSDPVEAAHKISKLSQIEWAEPKYVRTIDDNPVNDSLYLYQNNLGRIHVPAAWNISKGDSSVVIGIVDTGVDFTHPDLAGNIFTNKITDAEYPGDTHGWDFGGESGTADNDPHEDVSVYSNGYHGTHVAGIASGVTNNSIGVASVGYNCSILPVKVSKNNNRSDNGLPYVVYGFEGIKYAADKGAKVINCSWGGYSYSSYEQEIIDYAISKGALVVAAAGNDNTNELHYPSSYKGVLSVGWQNSGNDLRPIYQNTSGGTSGGNYGTAIDVMAPGTSVLSTWAEGIGVNPPYKYASGSSMSTPHVAGLAGLVFSVYKNYTPLQVAERIRATCDYDVTYAANSADSVKYMLGRGRINAERALSETNPISVRATDVKFIENGNGDGLFQSGEEAQVQITFTNYLSSVSNVKISLQSSDSSVEITESVFTTGSLAELGTINSGESFKFSVVPNGSYNHTVNFLIRFSGDNYSDFQWISVKINPTYDIHNNNDVQLTVTSKGNIGFNDYPNNFEGIGAVYKDQPNVLFEGSFMYGISENKLMDAARITTAQSADFTTVTPVKISLNNSTLEQTSSTIFNDDGAGSSKLGIKTTMLTYSFAEENNMNYVILRTQLENTTSNDIKNLYAGYYFDFDIQGVADDDCYDDMVGYDNTDNFGYAYDRDESPQQVYAGAALISDANYGFYAINQDSSTATVSPNNSNGFLDSEKWYSISNGIKKTQAGPADISYVISGGPYDISAGQTLDIAFTLACGYSVDEIRTGVQQSKIKWYSGLTGIEENTKLPEEYILYQNYPNPFNPETVIRYSLPKEGFISLKVYDILGREVATLVNEFQKAGNHNSTFSTRHSSLSSGVYFYRISSGEFSQTKKMLILK
jgi:serine protease